MHSHNLIAEPKPSLRPVSAVEVNKDEKIAILEYELRIAYEDLEKMRERLLSLQNQIQMQGVPIMTQSGKQKVSQYVTQLIPF